MKKIFLLLCLISCAFSLFAYGCKEEGTNYLVDDFGDATDQFWYVRSHIDGTYKLSSGATGDAGLHLYLNNFNSDIIFSIQDQISYSTDTYWDYVDDYHVWSNGNTYLSYTFSNDVTVKIKYPDNSVKSYKGTLQNDDICGSGSKKHVLVKNLKNELVGAGEVMVSISNSSVSYTFRSVSLPSSTGLFVDIAGDWTVKSSMDSNYAVGQRINIWPGERNSLTYGTKIINEQPTLYIEPGTKDNGPFYCVEFTNNGRQAKLTDISNELVIILEK